MEGRRGFAWVATVLACAAMAGASGCGGDGPSGAPGGVATASPEETFAPLVEVAADEPWRPMSARWLIERSSFWFAEDEGCEDRKIAVGHTMPEQQNPTIDWIYPKGLGGWSWPAYYRNPYDATCELNFDHRFSADELTRPHDPGPRVEGIRPGEGFYLDLADDARPGPPLPADGAAIAQPVYVERTDEGDGGVRLTYWMLFGMHGEPGEPGAHEGDWERIDVLLRDLGDDRYEPLAAQTAGPDGGPGASSGWAATRRVEGTHPVVGLERATHTPAVVRPGQDCGQCASWPTWRSLADARKEVWYGFGGAWGEVGSTDATTGPLGPHRFWPSPSRNDG